MKLLRPLALFLFSMPVLAFAQSPSINPLTVIDFSPITNSISATDIVVGIFAISYLIAVIVFTVFTVSVFNKQIRGDDSPAKPLTKVQLRRKRMEKYRQISDRYFRYESRSRGYSPRKRRSNW